MLAPGCFEGRAIMTDTATVTPLLPVKTKPSAAALRQRRYRANKKGKQTRGKGAVTPPADIESVTPSAAITTPATSRADVTPYIAALALAGSAAWFSVRGMTVLFPGAPLSVIAMSVAMESAKLVTAGWLARGPCPCSISPSLLPRHTENRRDMRDRGMRCNLPSDITLLTIWRRTFCRSILVRTTAQYGLLKS
jgi:hypothetical protein